MHLKAEMSFDQTRMRIAEILRERFGTGEYGGPRCWIREMFDDYVVVEKDGKLWRVSYTAQDSDVTVGELEEVTTEYVPVGAVYIETAFAAEAQSADEEGLVWDCVMLRAGAAKVFDPESGLQFYFTPEFMAKAASAFEGVHCYEDHAPKLVGPMGKVVGFWTQVKAAGEQMTGRLNLFESEEGLRKKMLSAKKAGKLNLFGVSVHCAVDGEVRAIGKKKYYVPMDVVRDLPCSADLVPVPGAGGYVMRMAAARNLPEFESSRRPERVGGTQAKTKEEYPMKERIQKMLAAIRGWAADRAAALERELAALPEDDPKRFEQVVDAYVECASGAYTRLQAGAGDAVRTEIAAMKADIAEALKIKTEIAEDRKHARLAAYSATLTTTLADSKLPAPARKLVEANFKDREFTTEELTKGIEQVREAFANMQPEGRITYPVVGESLNEYHKLQIALHRTFGLDKDREGKPLPVEIKAFRGLREAYIAYTGDVDVSGNPDRRRLSAIFNNAGFPNALAATMNRALLKDYAAVDYRWREITSSITAPADFKTQERVRVGYLPDLATVDPEAADYAEIAPYTDEKVSYGVIQKGNLLTVTRKAIINDDLGALTKVVGRLGRAAARTLARRVLNKIISNAAYDVDLLALFHANHNNLGAAALSIPALNAAALLMYNQTEKDTSEVLGLETYTLWIPRALWEVAFAINQSEKLNVGPGIEENNPWHQKFGANNERIVVSPLFTDANDWYLFANPADVDILEVGFLQGRQEPEFFLADAIPAEQVFVADKIRYKVRHEYEAEILDFRGAFKAVVA